MVGGLEHAGVLDTIADAIISVGNGNVVITLTLILWVSAIASALIDKITSVATMIPLSENMAPNFGGADELEAWCKANV